ncbi:MAG: branched-chain amino acid aminotransferase [Candidatus Thermoplasmatota archaeon]|nr:branched-chain amino acid aminotransferase [bacterium]MDP7387909.1 branched-chain amino acid aminotransferase [Candidatus Thalassarchaeaceae archaeon]MEC7665198.1 branched-chain amino acid aminotransferase [Candidatus Thermoplasmatota archaeon]MEC8045099.1 branched-chain amino acid aminotransferase [Candidatus Thermoplasmatota archaeon]MEC9137340.1 branched-chain amino acid aminotransferase [Candidatus Thermoplasmatota archaeon]
MAAAGRERPPIDWDSLTFSFTETDRMFVANGSWEDGWSEGRMVDFQPLNLSPAACVLNYGQGLFEGMKARRTPDGKITLFRPEMNARRAAEGARRLVMPEVSESMFIKAVKKVAEENKRWVPPHGKGELYLRPILFGSSARLGVSPAEEYMFVVFAVPVGPYFKGGMTPISLRVSQNHHRAAPGGSGGVKAIGNYAPGMMPSKRAKSEGYSEIIYLDAVEHNYVEEVGAANFFCVKDGIVYTPELTGTILPGITRLSIIELARSMGLTVVEEKVSIDFALSCDEAFCAGTAAVISPIGSIQHGEIEEDFGGVGDTTLALYERLTGIMGGALEDSFNWTVEV